MRRKCALLPRYRLIGPSLMTMNRAAWSVSLCRCGLRYTYARLVSMGCMTATAAAAESTPEMAPSAGDPGVSR